MPHQELHSLSSKAEVAAAALGSVYAANELGEAFNDNNDDNTEHLIKAAVAATVAVGAYEMLKRTKERRNSQTGSRNPTDTNSHPKSHKPHEPQHHKRRLLEEAIGAYGLGKELLGDKKHHFAHLVAEGIGASGLIKDARDRVD